MGGQQQLTASPSTKRSEAYVASRTFVGIEPKTVLQEFYQVAFRKKLYENIEMLQADLDEWLMYYNTERTHQGKMCCGRTPMDTLEDGKRIWKEKFIA